jgi:TonB-linked SusC/RagA family outer membrane protein
MQRVVSSAWRAVRSPDAGRRWCPRWRLVSFALALAASVLPPGASTAVAQDGTVAGTVVAEGSQRPLANVQVAVQGQTGRGSITDEAGRFRITGVTGTQVTLQARRIGYRTATQSVRVGAMDIQFTLSEAAVSLEEVVVTGTATGTERRREIGNAVSTIQTAEIVEQAAPRNMQQLLNGRVPGVFVAPASGMVGSGQRIRIRGQNTFSLPADPLIYIDGVRVNNEAETGISIQAFGSGVVSRMNDINPEDIETIEILKGPAAATLYGTEAARGVINIITKKGSRGGTTYGLTVRQGAQWFPNPEGTLPVNYWRNPTTGQIESINIYALEKARGNDIFRTGRLQGYTGSVSGGVNTVRYFVSGDVDNDQGIDPTNDRAQFSGRANVQVTPNEKLDLSASTGYIRNNTRLACEAGCGGRMWSTLFATPALLEENDCALNPGYGCGFSRGFQGWTTEPYDVWDVRQQIHRFTGSLQASWRPLQWMTHRFTIGRDVTQEKNTELLPFVQDELVRFFWAGQFVNGYRYQFLREAIFDTYDYAGSVNFDLRPELRSTTAVGVQYYTKYAEEQHVQGEGFPGPGVTTVEGAALQTFQNQDFEENKTLGVYAQQQFGWRDRLFVRAAVRVDNNSAFGSDVDFVTYPKADASWVASEEPFLQRYRPSWLNTLRLRAAYGESGIQPETFAAVRQYAPVPGPGGTSAVSPALDGLGNANLKPERGRELELGFDAGFLGDRLGIDFTYYRTLTSDAILRQAVPPSGGFPGIRFVNAGEILNQGIEALIRGTILNSERLGWDVTLNLATNDGEVRRLNGRDTTLFGLGSIQHRIGYPAWSWFRERVVSAEYDPATGRAINVMCDDARGGATPCFNASGRVIAPRVFLGRSTPSTEGSLSSSLRFLGRFQLSGMLDFKRGFSKTDNNLRIRCQIFSLCLENVEPQNANPVELAQMQTTGTLVDFVINDASYTKLREVSLNIDVPQTWTRRFIGGRSATVNFAARNLKTWTNYTGLDPEVMFLGGTITFEFEQNQIPHPRQFVTTVHVNF